MRYRFPQRLKLKESAQFNRVFNQAQKISTNKFAIFYCANDIEFPRLGIIVSKKNIYQAHNRNTFKRTVRESFRQQQHDLGSYDYIVFAYKVATAINTHELRQYLDKTWEKLVKAVKK